MDENPYLAPQSELPIEPRSPRRLRLTGGTIVLAGLGLALLILGVWVIVSVNKGIAIQWRERQVFSVWAFVLAVFGLSLVVHGVIRTEFTSRLMVLALLAFAASVVAVPLLGLL